MNNDNNSGWNNSWNNDNYGDNSQWNSNSSPWEQQQGGGQWGNGNFNQNWSNDSFGSGYQQNYGGGAQRGGGYSGNNRMVPYSNQSKNLTNFKREFFSNFCFSFRHFQAEGGNRRY
jgi:heterogeneous nuclear ribonucleoprotein A1/A3